MCKDFLGEETSKKCEYFFSRGYFRKSEQAFKILRGFTARAFQIFFDKKASKTVIFQIEKSEEKKKTNDRDRR